MEIKKIKTPEFVRRRPRLARWSLVGLISLFVVFVLLYLAFFSSPRTFPSYQFVKINKGETTEEIASYLKEKSVIRSPRLFSFLLKVSGSEDKVISGYYRLGKQDPLFSIILKLRSGNFGYTPYRVTIPEGLSNKEIAGVFDKKLDSFDPEKFLRLTENEEGFLFPDTYYVAPAETEEEIAARMKDNFNKQIEPLKVAIDKSGRSLKEIMTIASLIEKEVRTKEDRRLVSGVIAKRLAAKMPLQIDAVFPYIIGKNTFEVTKSDLKVDSPYNTYLYKGLPPGPIANPGLDSIKAALEPTTSPYFYYLSDKDGKIHYAETFEQHKENVRKYIP